MKPPAKSILSRNTKQEADVLASVVIIEGLKERGTSGTIEHSVGIADYNLTKKTVTLENVYILTTDGINYLHEHGISNINIENHKIPGCCVEPKSKDENSIKDTSIACNLGHMHFITYLADNMNLKDCSFACHQICVHGEIIFDNCIIDVLGCEVPQSASCGCLNLYSPLFEEHPHFNLCTIRANLIIMHVSNFKKFVEIKTHLISKANTWLKKLLCGLRGIYDCTIFDVIAPYFSDCKFGGVKQPDIEFVTDSDNYRAVFTINPPDGARPIGRLKDEYYIL